MTLSIGLLVCVCAVLVVFTIGSFIYLRQICGHLDKKSIPNDLQKSIKDNIDAAFHRHEQELTSVYAEERRLAEWVKSCLDEEDFDPVVLAHEANVRVVALSIKMVEDEATFAANELTKIMAKKVRTGNLLADSTQKHLSYYGDSLKTTLVLLDSQEANAKARIAHCRDELQKLTEVAACLKEANVKGKPST